MLIYPYTKEKTYTYKKNELENILKIQDNHIEK